MRSWRPSHRCMYVIPEVHGSLESLKIILNRLLPLRYSNGEYDRIIFLGDYIAKGKESSDVIQLLLEVKREYGENIICLKGNHEQEFLAALSNYKIYYDWISRGGRETIESYGAPSENILPYNRIKDFVSPDHISFIESMPTHIHIDGYLMFHGGVSASNPFDTDDLTFTSDLAFSKNVKLNLIKNNRLLDNSELTFVGSHNFKGKLPFIHSKYFMLGGSAPSSLIVFEINSMSCVMIKSGKSRIYKHNYKYIK